MNQPKPSKSAKKRKILALQDLGVQLTLLTDEQLETLEIGDDLKRAVQEARRIKSHGALRRQKQLIGKIMRRVDAEPIRAALHDLGQQERVSKATFRNAEQWRDRIIAEGTPAVAAFAETTGDNVPELMALARDLSNTVNDAGRKKISRQIFRAVHQQLLSATQGDAE